MIIKYDSRSLSNRISKIEQGVNVDEDDLSYLTPEEIDRELAASSAKIAAFHAANPDYVMSPEEIEIEKELRKVLAEIARIEGRATEVRAPAAQELAAAEIVPDPPAEQAEAVEKEEPERPAEQAAGLVKPTVNVASLPGYGPMTDAEAERELRRYRGNIEGDAWRRNPLSWWRDH